MTPASSASSVSMTRRIHDMRHGVRAAGSGTGDTGDTLLKQTHSPPPAPPSGQEHAFASGRTRGRPGRLPGKPPRCPECPRPRPARPTRLSRHPRAPWPPCAPTSPPAPSSPCAAFCAAFAFCLETLGKAQGVRIPLRPLKKNARGCVCSHRAAQPRCVWGVTRG